jgi:hypothetical protein
MKGFDMTLSTLARKAAKILAATGVAASLVMVGQQVSEASTAGVPAGTVVFTPVAGSGMSTQATMSCSVTYPYVTDNYTTGQFSWSAAVGCNVVLRMQGTTVMFPWGTNSAYAYGSSYDQFTSYSTSSGTAYTHSGTWGVNNNVLLFIPAGYTAALGAGCYYVNSSQIHCTATTGPITAH